MKSDTELLRQAKGALGEQIQFWYSLPSGVDEEAHIDDDSPEDASAHTAGLAVQAAYAVIAAIEERLLVE